MIWKETLGSLSTSKLRASQGTDGIVDSKAWFTEDWSLGIVNSRSSVAGNEGDSFDSIRGSTHTSHPSHGQSKIFSFAHPSPIETHKCIEASARLLDGHGVLQVIVSGIRRFGVRYRNGRTRRLGVTFLQLQTLIRLSHTKRTHGLTSHQEPCLSWQGSRDASNGAVPGRRRPFCRCWNSCENVRMALGEGGKDPEKPAKELGLGEEGLAVDAGTDVRM
ncbi:hypothetical protein B0H14DRAFT_3155564 [Mycena olivaceomarginata]|nr:hypothetical protein B0H14DRAFT_3155564 [Mycena olivaceomarginata]